MNVMMFDEEEEEEEEAGRAAVAAAVALTDGSAVFNCLTNSFGTSSSSPIPVLPVAVALRSGNATTELSFVLWDDPSPTAT